MNRDEAEELSILLLQVIAKLDDSAAFVRDKDSEENWHKYRRAVGVAIAEVGLELAGPLYRRFPELKPKQLDGTYEVDLSIYEPRFYDSDAPAT